MSRTAVVVTAVVAVVALATSAWAFYAFTTTTANRAITARSLVAPTGPTATVAGSTTVNLAWTAASNVTGAQYAVTNTVDNHVACTVTATATGCSDTAALPGVANTYSIRTTLTGSTWVSSAVAATSAATPDLLAITDTALAAIGTQTAGVSFAVKVTAKKWNGTALATDTAYTGNNKAVTWSGLTNSPNASTPTYPNSSVSFTSGVSTTNLNVIAVNAASQTLSIAEGPRTGSATFTVNPGGTLSFTSTSASCPNGGSTPNGTTSWTAKVSRGAQDAFGNTVSTTPSVAVTITSNKGSLTPSSLTIASGASESSGSFTLTPGTGTTAVTASATGFTDATCSVK